MKLRDIFDMAVHAPLTSVGVLLFNKPVVAVFAAAAIGGVAGYRNDIAHGAALCAVTGTVGAMGGLYSGMFCGAALRSLPFGMSVGTVGYLAGLAGGVLLGMR